MLYNTHANRWLRLICCRCGRIDFRIGTESVYRAPEPVHRRYHGRSQLVRTLLQTYVGLDFGPYDVAGILYFITNIPILIFAYKNLGRGLVIRTVICTVAYSFFYSIIPTPSAAHRE